MLDQLRRMAVLATVVEQGSLVAAARQLQTTTSAVSQQLRALEAFCAANTRSAPARFVLAYHYLKQGHTDAAVKQLDNREADGIRAIRRASRKDAM